VNTTELVARAGRNHLGLKCIILNAEYPEYLTWLYSHHPGLEKQPYDEQLRVRNETLFGTVDFYSSNLRRLGIEAYDIYVDNEFMQTAWAREHRVNTTLTQQCTNLLQRGIRAAAKTPLRHLRSFVRPVLKPLRKQEAWLYDVLAAQIEYSKPDILLNEAMNSISTEFLREMKPHMRFLVGQHAATRLSEKTDYRIYDLVVSSFPPTLDWFHRKGIPAELNRLGFEPKVLSYLKPENRIFGVTFIGSFFAGIHNSRAAFLESLCDKIEGIRIWGTGIDQLPLSSPIRKCYMGQAWGRDMYQILANSKITLNHHGDIAPYANNMRLYEATGTGALLVTDWKENLPEMFNPGKEVVAYNSLEECVELIEYYLDHEEEREAIGRGGQGRTLRDHTYSQRMQEFVAIVEKYI
jgi:spore maturation protein CgeB